MATYKNLKGRLTISRPRGANAEYIEISVVDASSGTEFVAVRVGLENFAEALVGLGMVECDFDLRPDRVGLRYENKEEFVPFNGKRPPYAKHGLAREKAAIPFLAPFEVDGWKGRVDDLFNPHRTGQDGARVTFVRYVPVTAVPPSEAG